MDLVLFRHRQDRFALTILDRPSNANVIQIMITVSSLLIASGNSPNPRELYVSISHVRTSVRSLMNAEIEKRFLMMPGLP